MFMGVSVYMIYVLACLLAVSAAILSGILLLETFKDQQRDVEVAQVKAGSGQVSALLDLTSTTVTRIRATTDANSRQALQQIRKLPAGALRPATAIRALNQSVFDIWVPWVKAPNQVNGVGITLMFKDEVSGELVDRSFWAYWEQQKSGILAYIYGYTDIDDNLFHGYELAWPTYDSPTLGRVFYRFNVTEALQDYYQADDFFTYALPWAATDGNSYWYFSHIRSFALQDAWLTVQTWEAGIGWLEKMQAVLSPGAEMILFDSKGYVMAATVAAEVRRLAQCQGSVNETVAADCIAIRAGQHPTAEIRAVYAALHEAHWDDLMSPLIPVTVSGFQL
eukprot:EG_transcript_19362